MTLQKLFYQLYAPAFQSPSLQVRVNYPYEPLLTLYRSFRPDFILIRQPIRDASRDYRHLLLALMYANIPAVNSLESLYTFLDKPLIFGQLIQIQQRLGRDRFPLIQQCFYPNHREMLTSTSFPVVIKIGKYMQRDCNFRSFKPPVGTKNAPSRRPCTRGFGEDPRGDSL